MRIRWIALFAALTFGAIAPQLTHAGEDPNMEVVKSFADDVINGQNLAAVDRLFAADYREHTPTGVNEGSEAFKGFATAIFIAFPDVKVRYTPVVSSGDMITVYGHVTATHQGPLFGIPATGKSVAWTELHVFRIRDGQIAEHWVEANLFGLMQQIQSDE